MKRDDLEKKLLRAATEKLRERKTFDKSKNNILFGRASSHFNLSSFVQGGLYVFDLLTRRKNEHNNSRTDEVKGRRMARKT
jgi:hypothetical protein